MSRPSLELQPVGGLGRFGANCLLVRYEGDAILVDLGWRPPDADLPGVEGELPDLERLDWSQFKLHGVALTHGHEDHIGAIPHSDLRGAPVYGTRYTLAILRRKLDRIHRPRFDGALREYQEGGKSTAIGPFEITPISTSHSIPDARMLKISVGGWTLLPHWRFQLGPDTDEISLKALGDEGVDLMLCDSTNADVPGETPSEKLAADRILNHVSQASGTVLLTTFSSHINRILSTHPCCAAL